MRVAVEINVAPFVNSHGARPRGWGMWGFCPEGKWKGGVDYLPHVMWHTGKYSDAVRSARTYFGEKGVATVVVCP